MCLSVLNKWWNVLHKRKQTQDLSIKLKGGEQNITFALYSDTKAIANITYLLDNRMVSKRIYFTFNGEIYIANFSVNADSGSRVFVSLTDFTGIFTINDTAISSIMFFKSMPGITGLGLNNVSVGAVDVNMLSNLNYLNLVNLDFYVDGYAIDFANSVQTTSGGAYLRDVTSNGEAVEKQISDILRAKGWNTNIN